MKHSSGAQSPRNLRRHSPSGDLVFNLAPAFFTAAVVIESPCGLGNSPSELCHVTNFVHSTSSASSCGRVPHPSSSSCQILPSRACPAFWRAFTVIRCHRQVYDPVGFGRVLSEHHSGPATDFFPYYLSLQWGEFPRRNRMHTTSGRSCYPIY